MTIYLMLSPSRIQLRRKEDPPLINKVFASPFDKSLIAKLYPTAHELPKITFKTKTIK